MPESDSPALPKLIEGEDYTMEGPYLVFTAAYHRKRGYCCGSGCRNCPWREATEKTPAPNTQGSTGAPEE